MRASALSAALAALLAGHVHAQMIINELTFGHTGQVSPDARSGRIPNFVISGQPQQPQLLSDRLILTPVHPGNQRGAVWAEHPLARSSWEADVDFRASGPERGGGNLVVWLARNGAHEVGTNSVYTVGRFDGLALVVDTHGGTGGMIRGFLNDGAVDYAHQHAVDKLAFGHCQYSYRNLGRPSSIKMRQTHAGFRVEVDGHLCFETDKVSIPAGYFFGITAASPDTPDSFEVFRMVVQSDSTVSGGDNAWHNPTNNQQQQHHDGQHQADALPDQPATQFKTSTAQFEDLHNRVQAMGHQLANIYEAVAQHHHENGQWHQHVNRILEGLRSQLTNSHQDALANKVKDLETELRAMHNDMSQRLVHHHDSLRSHMNDHHLGLADAMVYAVPGHGKLIFIFVGTQVLLVAAYVMYKRRRASMPKKYL